MVFYWYVFFVDVLANLYFPAIPSAITDYYHGAIQLLPCWVLLFDIILPAVLFGVSYAFFKLKRNRTTEWLSIERFSDIMVLLFLSVVLCIIINHSLYVTISFINDPFHATTVTIYYAVFALIYLIVLKNVMVLSLAKTDSVYCAVISVAPVFVVILLLQVFCTLLYIYIPIEETIDDIPYQLGVQSLLQLLTTFFVGLIAYKFMDAYSVRIQNTQGTGTQN